MLAQYFEELVGVGILAITIMVFVSMLVSWLYNKRERHLNKRRLFREMQRKAYDQR